MNNIKEQTKKIGEWFSSLNEKEQIMASEEFNQLTGGTLSAFSNPKPVVVAVIPVLIDGEYDDYNLLAIRRAIPPNKGKLAFPGGFMENGESASTAIIREVMEETGITFNEDDFFIRDMPVSASNNTLLIFLTAKNSLTNEDIEKANLNLKNVTDGEAFELVSISNNDILSFPLHQQIAKNFFDDSLTAAMRTFPKKQKNKPVI